MLQPLFSCKAVPSFIICYILYPHVFTGIQPVYIVEFAELLAPDRIKRLQSLEKLNIISDGIMLSAEFVDNVIYHGLNPSKLL